MAKLIRAQTQGSELHVQWAASLGLHMQGSEAQMHELVSVAHTQGCVPHVWHWLSPNSSVLELPDIVNISLIGTSPIAMPAEAARIASTNTAAIYASTLLNLFFMSILLSFNVGLPLDITWGCRPTPRGLRAARY